MRTGLRFGVDIRGPDVWTSHILDAPTCLNNGVLALSSPYLRVAGRCWMIEAWIIANTHLRIVHVMLGLGLSWDRLMVVPR